MRRRRLTTSCFEQLEQRRVLAGNVIVSVLAGQLLITGDNLENDIVLVGTANPGEFRISSGIYSPTTINGGVAPLTVAGVVSHVSIDLRDGNDQVIFDSDPAAVFISGNVQIDMGAGWDTIQGRGVNNIIVAGSVSALAGEGVNNVFFAHLYVGGNLAITLGSSIDNLVLDSGSVALSVTIDTGASSDTVYMELAVAGDVQLGGGGDDDFWIADMVTPTAIGGGLFVTMDDGTLNIFNAQLAGDLVVQGSGSVRVGYSDIVGDVHVSLTDGRSSVAFAPASPSAPDVQSFGGNLMVEMGSAGGNINIDGANIAGDLVIRGGDGGNSINVTKTRAARSLLIDAGGGNDSVRVQTASAWGEATLLGGSGGDYIYVNNFIAGRSLYVNAAAGYDLVSISYCSIVQNLSLVAGTESDQVGISAVSARNLWLDAGTGYDAVRIEYSAFDTLYAQLGEGGDSLSLKANRVRIAALLDGGAGYDLLSLSGNLLTGVDRRNFEATVG